MLKYDDFDATNGVVNGHILPIFQRAMIHGQRSMTNHQWCRELGVAWCGVWRGVVCGCVVCGGVVLVVVEVWKS